MYKLISVAIGDEEEIEGVLRVAKDHVFDRIEFYDTHLNKISLPVKLMVASLRDMAKMREEDFDKYLARFVTEGIPKDEPKSEIIDVLPEEKKEEVKANESVSQ